MIRKDSSEINPYILDEDTRYKVNKSHFTLGDRHLREMQERHHARLDKVKKLAEQLGVEYTPCEPEVQEVIKRTETMQEYYRNKEKYDSMVNELLEISSPDVVLECIRELISNPK
ncbi:hypothetical protein DQT32_05180 [Salmonella enterica subsp. enterica serovar Braenderup]|nr:hypothetical protein [Salmonella enterica subsp. enterica serovar Braenderup]